LSLHCRLYLINMDSKMEENSAKRSRSEVGKEEEVPTKKDKKTENNVPIVVEEVEWDEETETTTFVTKLRAVQRFFGLQRTAWYCQ